MHLGQSLLHLLEEHHILGIGTDIDIKHDIDSDAYIVYGNLRKPGEWTKLWRLRVPKKVEVFMWRVARG